MANKIHWKLRKTHYGWEGSLDLPPFMARVPGVPFRAISAHGKGVTKAEAMQQAAGIASQIANNPLLQAALPPGTGVAVKAIGKLADAAGAGKAGKALAKMTGKGAKRLAKALKFW